MGSTVSVSSNISKVDVSKSANGEEQCVLYTTPDSRTCTFRASTRVDSASVTLRDYTFDREGTTVDIRVRAEGGNDGGVGTIDVKHGGNDLKVCKDPGQFAIAYGVPRVRVGFVIVTKHETDTHGDALFVTHSYASIVDTRFSLVVMQVWYDRGEGRFMCKLTGPSWHSSPLEAIRAMRKAYPSTNIADATGQQTTNITGLINNTGGPVHGDLNGSILNFYNFYLNNIK